MDHEIFEVDPTRLYGWQGYVGRRRVLELIKSIYDGEVVEPVVVEPRGEWNEETGDYDSWTIAQINNPERKVIDGGHHRSFAYLSCGLYVPCRYPGEGDKRVFVQPRPIFDCVTTLELCSEEDLSQRVEEHSKRMDLLRINST